MDVYILSAPHSFLQASRNIRTIVSTSPEVFKDLIDVLMKGKTVIVEEYIQQLTAVDSSTSGSMISENAVISAADAMRFIIHGARKYSVSAKELGNILLQTTDFGMEATKICVKKWKSNKEMYQKSKELNKLFSVGILDKVDWKIGVSMCSSSCETIRRPFITLQFHVSHSSGNKRVMKRSVELSIDEFKAMHNTLREVSSVFD